MAEAMIDVHVRLRPDQAEKLQRCLDFMTANARVRISRSAGAAAVLEIGIKEYLRKREEKAK